MAELLLPFAKRRSDGAYVSPEEVPRGQACDCVCPDCESPVLARQGGERVWHFAHVKARKCVNAYVRAVHELAKQLLCERLDIVLPPLEISAIRLDAYAQVVRESELVQPSLRIRLESCLMGQVVEQVSVDLLGTLKGRSLIIEVIVGHPTSQDKVRRFAAAGIAALEIDLGQFRTIQATRERVEAALFEQVENRRWLWHPLEPDARCRINARLEHRLAEVAAAKRLEDEQRRQAWRASYTDTPDADRPHVFVSATPDDALRWRAAFPDESQWRPAQQEFVATHGLPPEMVAAVMGAVSRRSDLARVSPQQLASAWAASLGVSTADVCTYFRNAGYTC